MPYPVRHLDLDAARERGRWARLALRERRPLDELRWHRIGRGLSEGDPLADAVVAWMREQGHGQGWARFARASEFGLDALPARDQHRSLVALFRAVEQPPPWFEPELLALGGRVLDRCHPVPYYVLRNMGLLAGYSLRDLNKPLIMTGALRGGTSRRVAQTMKWTSDCIAPSGLRRGAAGYRSTLHVRLLHASIRARLAQHPDWDAQDMGLPINQTDMAATWLGFSAVFLGGARLMGVSFTAEEARAVMHLWKYACWLLGVDEHWLSDDEHEGRRLLFELLSTFRGPDESSAALGRALMDETRSLPYPYLQSLSWRIETAKHLSTAALVLGPGGMRKLGLPAWVPPWYPAASFGWNLGRSHLLRRAPTQLREFAERRGRAQREAQVRLHFRGSQPDLQQVSTQTAHAQPA